MNKYVRRKQFYPLLLLLIVITSCHRQNKTDLPKDSVSEQKIIATGQPKIIKTQGTDKYDNVQCGLLDKAGNLWFGTTGEGVYRYDGKAFINFTDKDGLCNNNVWSILEDKAGNIWFGTSSGVCRYDGKSFTHFSIPSDRISYSHPLRFANDNPYSKSVSSLLQDEAGNIWIGTDHIGVYRYNGKSFTNFLSDDSIPNYGTRNYQAVQCVFEDTKGNIWFGSWNRGGVFRYDGKSFTNFTWKEGLSDDMIRGISEDKAGNILFVTRDDGVCSYDGKSFTNFSEKLGLSNNNICCMLEATNGNIWFGTDGKMDNDGNGVYRYDGTSFTNFTTKDGLSNNNVFTIIEDKTGNIWFGTRNVGLCRYDGRSFTGFSE